MSLATPHTSMRFRLFRFRSPLLSESLLISFPPGTEMFQFPGFASYPYVFRVRFLRTRKRVSSFGHPRITAWLTAPRGLSQPPTSFIACFSQGIHTMRYVTFSFSIVRKSPTNRILTDNRLTVENVPPLVDSLIELLPLSFCGRRGDLTYKPYHRRVPTI